MRFVFSLAEDFSEYYVFCADEQILGFRNLGI